MTSAVLEPTTLASAGLGATASIDRSRLESLLAAVQKYFDLMYDCDTSRFGEVFRPTAHLHGFRDGEMAAWSADVYKDILNKRQSPKAQHAPREDEILCVDFASPLMALVKVRVRIATSVFIDYLT